MGVIVRVLVVMAVASFGLQAAEAAEPADPPTAVFDEIAARAVAKQGAPGLVFVVVHRGRTAYARGFGLADVGRNEPVTTDTRFVVGSISKQFTAASVLRLRDAGKLRLEDPLARYLPQLPNAGRITLRMLLNQTSGLHNYPLTTEHPWPLNGSIAPERLFAFLATDQPDFDPGAKFEYSNTNYAVLAEVVARASGMSYDQYLRKEIFAPLAMASSASWYPAQQAPHATPYTGATRFTVPNQIISLDLFYGAGSVIASASDTRDGTSHCCGASSLGHPRCTICGARDVWPTAERRHTRWASCPAPSADIARSGTTGSRRSRADTVTTRSSPTTT